MLKMMSKGQIRVGQKQKKLLLWTNVVAVSVTLGIEDWENVKTPKTIASAKSCLMKRHSEQVLAFCWEISKLMLVAHLIAYGLVISSKAQQQ